jgi:hypothetical protein
MISITEMEKSSVWTLLEALPIENLRLSVFSLEIKDTGLAHAKGIVLRTALGGRAIPLKGRLREPCLLFYSEGTGGGRSRGRRKIDFQQFQPIGVAQNTGEVGGAGIPTLCLLGTGL